MEFIINEHQLRTILAEQDKSRLGDYMKKLYSFTSNIVNKVIKKFDINVKLLLTWGTSVGGLVLPLDNFIKSGQFNLNDTQRALILVGVAAIVFFENKRLFSKILSKVKELGLEEVLKIAIEKATKLKQVFAKFLNSLNITLGSAVDIVAYSFIIPIIADIQDMIKENSNVNELASLITERLIASGVVVLGYEVLNSAIKKIIKRLK